jgi:hypothetical protein
MVLVNKRGFTDIFKERLNIKVANIGTEIVKHVFCNKSGKCWSSSQDGSEQKIKIQISMLNTFHPSIRTKEVIKEQPT